MTKNNQINFLNTIITNNIPHSCNKNGTFINISELTSTQLNVILQFIQILEVEEATFNKIEDAKTKLKELIDKTTNITHDDNCHNMI